MATVTPNGRLPITATGHAPGEDITQRTKYCMNLVCRRPTLVLSDANELTCERCGVVQGRGLPSEEREYRCFGEDKAEDDAKKRAERDDRWEDHAAATDGLSKTARDRYHQICAMLRDMYAEHPERGVATLTRDEVRQADARARVAAEELGKRVAAAIDAGEEPPAWKGSSIAWSIFLTRDACARRGGCAVEWLVEVDWAAEAWSEDTLWARFAGAKSERFYTAEKVGNATRVSGGHREAERAVARDATRQRRVDDLGSNPADRIAKLEYLDELLRHRNADGLHAVVLTGGDPTYRPFVPRAIGRAAAVLRAQGLDRGGAAPTLVAAPLFAPAFVTLRPGCPKALVVEDDDDDYDEYEGPKVAKLAKVAKTSRASAPAAAPYRESSAGAELPSDTESEAETEADDDATGATGATGGAGEPTGADEVDDDMWDEAVPAGPFDPNADPDAAELERELEREMSEVRTTDARRGPCAGLDIAEEADEPFDEKAAFEARVEEYMAKGWPRSKAEWLAGLGNEVTQECPRHLVAPRKALKKPATKVSLRTFLKSNAGQSLANVRARKEAIEANANVEAEREAKRVAAQQDKKRKELEKAAADVAKAEAKVAEAAAVVARKNERRDGAYETRKATAAQRGGCAARQDIDNPLKFRFTATPIAKPDRVSRGGAQPNKIKIAIEKVKRADRLLAKMSDRVFQVECDECDKLRTLPWDVPWPSARSSKWCCDDAPSLCFVCEPC